MSSHIYSQCVGLTLASSWASQLLAYFQLIRMGKRIGRIKPRKFEYQDNKTLIGIIKLTWKQSKIRNFLIISHWKSLSPRCYGWSWYHVVWSILLVSLGQLFPAMFPPSFLHTLMPLLKGGKWEKDKSLLLCEYCSAIGKTLLCFQHWFSYKSKTRNDCIK